MQTFTLSRDFDEWYDNFDKLSKDQEKADAVLSLLKHPMNEDEFDEYDIGGLVLDIIGPYFGGKKDYEAGLDIIKQFELLQPENYRSMLNYFADYLFDHAAYHGNWAQIAPLIQFSKENPNKDIELFFPFFNDLWYWMRKEEAYDLALENYAPVNGYDDYIGTPELDLALCVHNVSMQALHEQYINTGVYDDSEAKVLAKKVNLDFPDVTWDLFKTAHTLPFDLEKVSAMFSSQIKHDLKMELDIHFMKWAYARGFQFHTAYLFWDEFYDYCYENNKNAKSADYFFKIEQKSYEKYVLDTHFLSFSTGKHKCSNLWGAVFVVDFLLEHGLITAENASNAYQIIVNLKSKVRKQYLNDLWANLFVTRVWPKPDSISQSEFDADAALFEKTYQNKEAYSVFYERNKELFDAFPAVNDRSMPIIIGKKQPEYEKIPRPPKNPKNKAKKKKKK